jgi:hypothetical protein
LTRKAWLEQAEEYERKMAEIGDPDDSTFRLYEAKARACRENAVYGTEE